MVQWPKEEGRKSPESDPPSPPFSVPTPFLFSKAKGGILWSRGKEEEGEGEERWGRIEAMVVQRRNSETGGTDGSKNKCEMRMIKFLRRFSAQDELEICAQELLLRESKSPCILHPLPKNPSIHLFPLRGKGPLAGHRFV